MQFWIPQGFAHGFLTVSESADVFYKATEFWNASNERTIMWNDPNLKINWPNIKDPKISEKDQKGLSLREFEEFCFK